MKHLLTIIGARPQFIKAAALSRAISLQFSDRIRETIVHTGQHYDENMSQVFFDELKIPQADYKLEVGSDTHGRQTAGMIEQLEGILQSEMPDYVILYGDTNSTLAGAVAAAKLNIPIAHIEAGLRSFNKSMPEEINRIVCDHCSTLLFAPTQTAVKNLINEGFLQNKTPISTPDNPSIINCGDIMYDNSLHFANIAAKKSTILQENNLQPNKFILATVHRDSNTDDPERLSAIFSTLEKISSGEKIDVLIPMHPRTAKMIENSFSQDEKQRMKNNRYLKTIPPASFYDILVLEQNCRMVMTDSGGLQKEAYFFKKPVIILRPETEWVEIVDLGNGLIADADPEGIFSAFQYFNKNTDLEFPQVFGDGYAAICILKAILNNQE